MIVVLRCCTRALLHCSASFTQQPRGPGGPGFTHPSPQTPEAFRRDSRVRFNRSRIAFAKERCNLGGPLLSSVDRALYKLRDTGT